VPFISKRGKSDQDLYCWMHSKGSRRGSGSEEDLAESGANPPLERRDGVISFY